MAQHLHNLFDLYIGIDWTGARASGTAPPKGIAIAAATADGTVAPVAPPGRGWSRQAAGAWVLARVAEGRRVLAGFDFAFGLPWVPGVGYLDGRVAELDGLFGVWDLVEAASGDAADDFAGAAVTDPRLAPSFWIGGKTPAHWGDGSTKRRRTEIAAARAGLGTPVSVYNLAAAAKQVGKASLAGMRTLRRLRAEAGGRIAVWPAEAQAGPDGGRSVVCEIYPTLFRLRATGSNRKITDRAVLEAAAARLDARLSPDVPDLFDDHAGDAMISAAGLRLLAAAPEAWAPRGLDADTGRREGWIFGVADAAGDGTT